MKLLRKELVDFIKTISHKELSLNNSLREKINLFNNYMKEEGLANKFELSKYLNNELLQSNKKEGNI